MFLHFKALTKSTQKEQCISMETSSYCICNGYK